MVSLLSRGLGNIVKSLTELSCTQTARCISLPNAVAIQCMTARWFSKNKNPSLSDAPKYPVPAFTRFVLEQRPLILAKHPELVPREIFKMVGEKWRALKDFERQEYTDAARLEMMTFKEANRKYKENIDPLVLKLIQNKKLEKQQHRNMFRLRKELKASGPPQRWRSSFLLFYSEHFSKSKEDSFNERCRKTREKWKALSSTEKQVYNQLYEDDRIRYINELKAWEERMKEIGREDLIQLFKQKKKVSADKGPIEKNKKGPATQRNTQARKLKKS